MANEHEIDFCPVMLRQLERYQLPPAPQPSDPSFKPINLDRLIQSNQSAKSLDQVHAWIAQGEHRVGNPEEGATAQLGFDSPTPLHTIQSNQAKSLLREEVK